MSKEFFEKEAKKINFKRPKKKLRKLDYILPFFIFFLTPCLYFYQKYLFWKKKIFFGKIDSDIGSAIVSTNLISIIHIQQKIKPIIIARYPEIFYNNPHCEIIDFNKMFFLKKIWYVLLFRSSIKLKFLKNIVSDSYLFENDLFKSQKKLGLWAAQAKHTGYFVYLLKNKPQIKINFNDNELKLFKYIILKKKYYLVLSEVVNGMNTKNWGYENMQELVNKMPEINWVQIGTLKEKKLNNTKLDLRGKTTLREVFYLVKNCEAIVCTEGMYTHLSSAFNKKCFTIFSGYHPVEISTYPNVIPITRQPQMPCAYCWLYDCPLYKEPKCIRDITVDQVINVIRQN